MLQKINTTHLGTEGGSVCQSGSLLYQLIKQKPVSQISRGSLPCSPRYSKIDTKRNVRSLSWEVRMFREDRRPPAFAKIFYHYFFVDFASSYYKVK